ncbi:MAG: NADH-quinone oxidoreductase subunit NuoH [Actinobacteria bacterium]|nr:NADH-quinone oxidoreductase subunit NuoH [Actinomycetota bacterium]
MPGFALALAVIAASAIVFPFVMRRIWGFMCDRLGPNRVGPQGLLQPLADGLKLFIKEDITPAQANRLLFILAPAVALVTPMLTQVVIPFSDNYTIADLNIGLIYVVAVGAFSVLGILIAGWASNNKYSLVGGLRAAAQMISYEIPLILNIIVVALLTGSLSLNKVVDAQSSVWFAVVQPLGFIIYVIAGVAELNRTPFDLPEAESELVSGYNTEYSGMRFAFFAAFIEWGNVTVWAMAGSTLFLGGWRGPFINSAGWLAIKVAIMALVIIWFFATFPRLQIDQLMAFAWKVLIPLSLVNLAATSLFILIWPDNFLLPTAILSWSLIALFVAFFPSVVRKILLRNRYKFLASRRMTTMISGTGKGGIRS